MAANPVVKHQYFKHHNELLPMLFFNYILLLLQLLIHVGVLWGKILASCRYRLGFQCYNLLQESCHFSAVCCVEGLGGKGTYRGLSLAVID